jgi:hypothetical protein
MSDVVERPGELHERGSGNWRTPAIVGSVVALGTAAVVAIDPRTGGFPVCASQGLFGVDCPLCGGLRCVNALARGDVVAAADHNVLLAVALPAAAVLWMVWMVAAVTGRHLRLPTPPKWLTAALLAVVAAFSVTRNLDLGPVTDWLSSSPS